MANGILELGNWMLDLLPGALQRRPEPVVEPAKGSPPAQRYMWWRNRLQLKTPWRRRWEWYQHEAEAGPYFVANRDAIRNALKGTSPHGTDPNGEQGARMVANISSAHIVAFCVDGYKNCYDLKNNRIGDGPSKRREIVDDALPVKPKENIYFCTANLNGSGIRFYGDFCLVLRPTSNDPMTTILEKNFYDLERSPLQYLIEPKDPPDVQAEQRKEIARHMAGTWGADLWSMAALKTLKGRPDNDRLLTTAQIAEGVLSDEDYIEVLRIGTFKATDLEEARVSAADVSLQSRIFERARTGDAPSLEEQLWCRRRHQAEQTLATYGVKVHVVTSLGRTRP